MAFSFKKIIKGLLLSQDGTLTPKQISIEPKGTAGTKTAIESSQSTNVTITLPNATDTLVGKATVDVLTNKSIDADTNTITNIENTDIKAAAAIALNKLAATTASKALASDASGFIVASTATSTELATLSGVTSAIQTQIDSKIPNAEKAAANGVATLDVTGRIPASQLPMTAMEWKGNWDASTNTPTLSAGGTFSAGDVYRANVSGTVDIGQGPTLYSIGDWAVYNGTIFEHSPAPGAVASVFGRTGVVTAQSGDYTKAQVGLSNVDNTSDINKPVSTAQAAAISTARTSIKSHIEKIVNGNYTVANVVDGYFIFESNVTISNVYLYNITQGSSGTTEIDVRKKTLSGSILGTSIFSTTPKITSVASSGVWVGVGDVVAGCTAGILSTTNFNAGEALFVNIVSAQVGASDCGVIISFTMV